MVFLKLVAVRRMAGLFMVKGWAWRFLGSACHQWLKHHSEGSWWVPHEGKEEEVCFSELLNCCFAVDGKPSGVSSLGPCVDFFKELKIWRWDRRNVLNRTPNPNWQQPSKEPRITHHAWDPSLPAHCPIIGPQQGLELETLMLPVSIWGMVFNGQTELGPVSLMPDSVVCFCSGLLTKIQLSTHLSVKTWWSFLSVNVDLGLENKWNNNV